MFDTYGPFTLHSHDKTGIDRLYLDIDADEESELENGIGIYIIASNNGSDDWLPCYVGMTTREFGQRLKEHFSGGKFVELAGKGPLRIYLIALRDKKRIVQPSEATEAQKLIIEQLEQQLIDHCFRLNGSLINKKLWSPNQIHVPGYLDKGGKEREFGAALALAKLLKT